MSEPQCPWPETVWPTTIDEAGKLMREKLGDQNTTAISGSLMRHGWNLALEEIGGALDVAGCPIGNEHKSYGAIERIDWLKKVSDYAWKELDEARAELTTLRRFKAAALTLTTLESVQHVMEQEVEALWKLQKGVDPANGKMWLTPHMERDSVKIQEAWDAQQKLSMSKEKT